MPRPQVVLAGILVAIAAAGCRSWWTDPVRTPMPIGALGPTAGPGRVELPGSGFAITVPEGWTTEVAWPDSEVTLVGPGDAWEALRSFDADRRQTCSVYVAVLPVDGAVAATFPEVPGLRAPRWTGSAPELSLELPEAQDRIGDRTHGAIETSTVLDRPAAGDPLLDHDIVYVTLCAADGPPDFDALLDSFELVTLERRTESPRP